MHLSMDYTAVFASSGINVIAIKVEAGRFQAIFQELEERGSEIGTSRPLLANIVDCAHTLGTKFQLGLNIEPSFKHRGQP